MNAFCLGCSLHALHCMWQRSAVQCDAYRTLKVVEISIMHSSINESQAPAKFVHLEFRLQCVHQNSASEPSNQPTHQPIDKIESLRPIF